MSDVNEKELNRSLEKEDASLLFNLEIDMETYKELFPRKEGLPYGLQPHAVNYLQHSIRLYPLFGGGVDGNGKYNVIFAFQSKTMKIVTEYDNFEMKHKLKKRD